MRGNRVHRNQIVTKTIMLMMPITHWVQKTEIITSPKAVLLAILEMDQKAFKVASFDVNVTSDVPCRPRKDER